MTNKTILIITDGIGHNDLKEHNAFKSAKKPTYDFMFSNIPYSFIQTSGLSVGLPQGQMGNSEVGHMCLGSGRILYQNLVKINKSIQDNSLQNNKALCELINKSNHLHVSILLSDGGVHSHINHLIALAKIIEKKGKKLYIHAITDGRDVSPTSANEYILELEKILNENIVLASIGGRYFAMDRDNRWDRIKLGYDAMVHATPKSDLSAVEYVKSMYLQGITDEFIKPVCFGKYEGISKNDGIILANFRNDRMRQLAQALGDESFNEFTCKHKFELITMTNYDEKFSFEVMFENEKLQNTLCEVIAKNHLKQFHVAETEKYAHVTFFFNGGVEELVENETRVLVPSPKVATYDLLPQMSAKEVCDAVLKAMDEEYDFIVVNFANGDMVGHTGNFEAAVRAVEVVDSELGRILKHSDLKDYNVVLTSDHGNCEQMQDEKGQVLTNHTIYDVYCFVKSSKVKKLKNGGLNNIAPTILKLMDLKIPEQMDESLF